MAGRPWTAVTQPWRATLDAPAVRAALARPGTGVYVVDLDGNIQWASPGMADVTGWAPSHLVGRSAWGILVPPEVLPEVARFKAHLSDSDGCIWMPVVDPQGLRRWCRVDTWVVGRYIACAFQAEPSPSRHRVHFVKHGRS